MLLSSTTDHDLDPSDPDLTEPQIITSDPRSPPQEKTPASVAPTFSLSSEPPSQHTATHRIRLAFEGGWQRRMGQPYLSWSKQHAKNAQNIVTRGPDAVAEAISLLDDFFDWQHPQVIDGGYSFCQGNWCFIRQLDALRARRANPQLQRAVRALDAAQRQVGNDDAEQIRFAAELAAIRAKREQEQRTLNAATSPGARGIT